MNRYSKKHLIWIGILLALTIFALLAANRTVEQRGLLVEVLPTSEALKGSGSDQPQVYLLPEKSTKKARHLSKGLFAATSPDVYHDGKKMVFSAKADENGPWQIYEYDFDQGGYAEVFSSDSDCFDPVFLPTGDILFSSSVEVAPGEEDLALYVYRGQNKIDRITFTPYSFTNPLILHDGRVLALISDGPGIDAEALMVMRPDGTKNALFYKSIAGNHIIGDLRQLDNGDVLFLERNSSNNTIELVSVDYNRPLASRRVLDSLEASHQLSLGSVAQGKLLITRKGLEGEKQELLAFDLEKGNLDPIVRENLPGWIRHPLKVGPNQRPKKLPSAVNPETETALLMCQDIRITGADIQVDKASAGNSLEVQGMASSLGIVEVEPDGSFYLKLKADMPFRFQQLDQKGEPIGQPSAWISLRPNERRACIGCHVSSERVPENVQPLAVRKEPLDLSMGEKNIMANSMD